MEIEDRLGTEGLYSHCMLAPFCISIWCPVVSVVYTAIYTKSDQWDVDMSSLVITSSSESLYYLGLPRILNFLFSIQVDIAIILSWEWFPQPGYTQCVWNPVLFAYSGGWLKYRRLVLARHRIIRAAMPRMISSKQLNWASTPMGRCLCWPFLVFTLGSRVSVYSLQQGRSNFQTPLIRSVWGFYQSFILI